MVQFANPAALWLLGLILPLIALYLLKHKRRNQIVPSLLLWKQAVEDQRVQTPFQKLRSSLLLLLQILIIVLGTALLSEPYILLRPEMAGKWVLVLDVSASMKATDVLPDRFTEAKKLLIQTLAGIPPLDDVLVITASGEASVVQGFSPNHAATIALLDRIAPEDRAGSWHRLEQVLLPLMKQKPNPRIILASDFANFPAEFGNKIPFDPIQVGHTGDQSGITLASLSPLPEDPETQVLLVQVKNYAEANRSIELEIYRNENLVDAFRLAIGPGQVIDKTVSLQILEPSRIRARLLPQDVLTLDNDFVIPARPRSKIKVYAEFQNSYLLRALEVLSYVVLSPDAEIRIAERPANPGSCGIYFLPGSRETMARVIQWNQTHPALRFVDPSLWRFSKYSILTAPVNSSVLLETEQGPIAYAVEQAGRRNITVGFTLENSNLVRYAGFPVFLQNSILWINEGLTPQLPLLTDEKKRHEGPYTSGGREGYANFADIDESNIAPQNAQGKSAGDAETVARRRDLIAWLLPILIGIVILEWYIFHQKSEA